MLSPYDSMVGFAKIINDEANNCDVLYRLDERLSMPESEYHDFSGIPFAKFRGPQFNFYKNSLTGKKTITVHMNLESQDKTNYYTLVIEKDKSIEVNIDPEDIDEKEDKEYSNRNEQYYYFVQEYVGQNSLKFNIISECNGHDVQSH